MGIYDRDYMKDDAKRRGPSRSFRVRETLRGAAGRMSGGGSGSGSWGLIAAIIGGCLLLVWGISKLL